MFSRDPCFAEGYLYLVYDSSTARTTKGPQSLKKRGGGKNESKYTFNLLLLPFYFFPICQDCFVNG